MKNLFILLMLCSCSGFTQNVPKPVIGDLRPQYESIIRATIDAWQKHPKTTKLSDVCKRMLKYMVVFESTDDKYHGYIQNVKGRYYLLYNTKEPSYSNIIAWETIRAIINCQMDLTPKQSADYSYIHTKYPYLFQATNSVYNTAIGIKQ